MGIEAIGVVRERSYVFGHTIQGVFAFEVCDLDVSWLGFVLITIITRRSGDPCEEDDSAAPSRAKTP
jgi:hypothetical protein